jgi:hypothetical protein
MRGALAVALAVALGGCKYAIPTIEEARQAEVDGLYGPEPTDPAGAIRGYINEVLFDPYSVQDFSVGKPEQCYRQIGGPALTPRREWRWGWRVACSWNAKNRYGAYVGKSYHWAYFTDGALSSVE